MSVIVTGRDELFGQWAVDKIPHLDSIKDIGNYRAVGVAAGHGMDDELSAVFIFHDWYPKFGHCQISAASANPKWVSKDSVRAVLGIPFLQYGCHKVWVASPHTDTRTIRLCKLLGFRAEATLKNHFGKGTHAVISRMMDYDYSRIYWSDKNGND